MILPGISGSLILVLVGMYSHVLGAVNQRDLTAVGVFVLGAIVGLALFSQILHWALRNHHDTVLAALIGLMAGSLRVLWPWPDGVDSPGLDAPGGDLPQVVVAAVVGVVSVFIIARLAATKEDEVNEPQPSA
jgi:putative membrane protein